MRKIILTMAAALAWACNDSAGPPQPVPTSRLHFVLQDATAPALIAYKDSFYAKVGVDRRLELFYQGTGEPFLQFEVRPNALSKHPDGTPFGAEDSILITVSVVDPQRFEFTFAPSGLQFNPADPARLHIEYNHSNHDFNGDGKRDGEDDVAETKLNIWRSEPPDTLWTQVGAVKNEDLDEIEAEILSFTQYAVAW